MKIFQKWGTSHIGLFTFAESSKHVHLYQKFGFWPRFLTAVMSNSVEKMLENDHRKTTRNRYSQQTIDEKGSLIARCAALSNELYPGLDLAKEIRSVEKQGLGDTIFLEDPVNKKVVAFAICHTGADTEAGSGNCYLKFGAAKKGGDSERLFDELLGACAEYAASQTNVSRITAGINTARHNAYKRMIDRGFRTELQGVVMDKPNEPAYNRSDSYVIDDWR